MRKMRAESTVKSVAFWLLLIGGVLCVFGLPAGALAASLLGTTVTVNFDSPGNSLNLTDTVTVGGGHELSFGDGSNIGNAAFLDKEFIDIQALDIVYHAQGGGSEVPGHPGYKDLGWGDVLAAYTFSDLFSATEKITGVTVTLTNAILLNPSTDVTFTDHSVKLVVGTLGILTSTENTGDIRLSLTVEEIAAQVPEPASLALLTAGLVGLGVAVARRRRRA